MKISDQPHQKRARVRVWVRRFCVAMCGCGPHLRGCGPHRRAARRAVGRYCDATKKDKFLKTVTVKFFDANKQVQTSISDKDGYVKAGPFYVGKTLRMEVTLDKFDKYSEEITIKKNMAPRRIPLNPTVSILELQNNVQ